MATNPTRTTYLINSEGVLEVKKFSPRTFAEVLAGVLPKDWDKKPAKLAKAVAASPDLLTVLINIMNSFGAFLALEREKIEKSLTKRTSRVEKACHKAKKPFDADALKSDNEVMLLLKTLAFFDERLSDLESKTPVKWLCSLGQTEFEAVVAGIRPFLKTPVSDAWVAFSPDTDTAQGRAVEDMRNLSAQALDALELEFCLADDVSLPLAVATNLTAKEANKVARHLGLDIAFAEVKPKKSQKMPVKKNVTVKKASKKAPEKTKSPES